MINDLPALQSPEDSPTMLLLRLDLIRARRALAEYANPRNWTEIKAGWIYIDDAPPWGRAADALEDV